MLRPRTRRDLAVQRLSAGTLVVGLTVAAAGGGSLFWRSRHVRVPLLSETVAISSDGARAVLLPGGGRDLVPGTRVLTASDEADADGTRGQVRAERAWISGGRVPGDGGPYGPMVRDALLDLRALSLANGAALAGGPSKWAYVWPRDASFAAVALARTGHPADAVRTLEFLSTLQSADGSFQARYLPDGSGPPDDRGIQEDGAGWVLWATGEVLAALPAPERPAARERLLGMVDRASTRILALTADGATLPPPSSDYWEIPEESLTLGTVAPMLAGLEAARPVYEQAGQLMRAQRIGGAALRLRTVVEAAFGPHGYPRHARGDAVDAALTFVLPPFQPTPLTGAPEVWPAALEAMARPGGGVAPGAGWKNDGISWTPETALLALSAASNGHDDQAATWLTWLAAHRTASGSLPEKVLSDGTPAAVAPLSWTAALVVLTVDRLDR